MRCEYSFKYVHVWYLKSVFSAQQKRVRAPPRLSHYSLFMFKLRWTRYRAELNCAVQLFYTNNNWSATFNFSEFGFCFISFLSFQMKLFATTREAENKSLCVWALNRSFFDECVCALYTIYLLQIVMLSLVIHRPHLKYCEYCGDVRTNWIRELAF